MSRAAKLDLAAVRWVEQHVLQGNSIKDALQVYGASYQSWLRARARYGLPKFNFQAFQGKVRFSALHFMFQDKAPGRCAICDEKLPITSGRPQKLCKSKLCIRTYNRLYQAGKREYARSRAVACAVGRVAGASTLERGRGRTGTT